MEVFIQKKAMLFDIIRRYENKVSELYVKATSESDRVLMSRCTHPSLYGMFLPADELKYVFATKKGKLTKNPDKMEFRYFFDKNGSLVLTERYDRDWSGNHVKLNEIFYIRGENCIEIVFYNCEEKRIQSVAKVQYSNGKLYKYIISENISREIFLNNNLSDFFSYIEFTYNSYNYEKQEVEVLFEQSVMWRTKGFERTSRVEFHKMNEA